MCPHVRTPTWPYTHAPTAPTAPTHQPTHLPYPIHIRVKMSHSMKTLYAHMYTHTHAHTYGYLHTRTHTNVCLCARTHANTNPLTHSPMGTSVHILDAGPRLCRKARRVHLRLSQYHQTRRWLAGIPPNLVLRSRHCSKDQPCMRPISLVRQRYNGFHIFGKTAVTLYAETPEEKRYWMGLIEQVCRAAVLITRFRPRVRALPLDAKNPTRILAGYRPPGFCLATATCIINGLPIP